MEYRGRRKAKESRRRALNAEASLYGAQEAGVLEAEGETERTFKVSQREIRSEVAPASARNAWSREASCASVSTSENGRFAVACFESEVVALDLLQQTERTRIGEARCADSCFLQDETAIAVAQPKYVYVYDSGGVEIHRMPHHIEPEHLEYLRYHFLLASVGRSGYLKYHDVSTGSPVSQHKSRRALATFRNPQRATLSLCHPNGVVSIWSPAQPKALAKVLCHRAACSAGACAFDATYFATGSRDEGTVKFWDLRHFGRPLHTLKKPPTALAFSQRGLLAVGHSSGVDLFADKKPRLFRPYLSHRGPAVTRLAFRPFEDALLLATADSLDSIVVPGAGEPDYDALEGHNPYRTATQRKAMVVSSLLDKLPPETIALDDVLVGRVATDPAELHALKLETQRRANSPAVVVVKKKTRGRSKLAAKLRKKAKNVISEETNKLRAKLAAERDAKNSNKRRRATSADAPAAAAAAEKRPATALDRLFAT